MKGEWCYWQNFFAPDECQKIIQDALPLPTTSSTLGYDSATTNDNFRRSKLRWINEDLQWGWLYIRMWTLLRLVNNEWFKFNVTHLPPMQFTEYDASYQGTYGLHQDVFWINPSDRHRKVSIVIQLTDPKEYDGGNLAFKHTEHVPPVADIRSQGCAICFPAFTFHELQPVTRGRRYSLVAWFEGPKWT